MTLAHLCIGTASWNTETPYNERVPPSNSDIGEILEVATARGVCWLDTAQAYGDAEARIAHATQAGPWDIHRFHIVTKVKPGGPKYVTRVPAAVLSHLGPNDGPPDDGYGYERVDDFRSGASVYTVEQAMTALDHNVQVLQVPWTMGNRPAVVVGGEIVDGWEMVRDLAYADGVLFFGRQPFARGNLSPPWPHAREAFEWALRTNPRGWCVVGVETADQLRELCDWREQCK